MNQQTFVMPGLDPGIHAVTAKRVDAQMAWIAGSSPAMTTLCVRQLISQVTLTRTSTEAVPASMGTSFA
ncbi:MAG: hypothetical protein ACREIB_09560, partial [Pseudomonadota bacterium]